MPEKPERAPRKPYETAASKREALMEKIRDKYNRTPTSNELLALDNLPCSPLSQLFDRSRLGITIYQRLRYVEDTGNVSVLEEAGRLLRLQMTNQWTPTTSVNGDDDSSAPDPAEEHGFNGPPGQRNGSAPADMANGYRVREMPFCPNPTHYAARNCVLQTAAVPGVKARTIHGDVYFMPVNLRFDGHVSNSSVAINVPGRATTTYPEKLTSDGKPGPREEPPGPSTHKDSAEIARTNGKLVAGGREGL